MEDAMKLNLPRPAILTADARLARRTLLTLLATVALAGVGGMPVSAQDWRVHRPEGFGFRVELPADPEIFTEQKTSQRYGALTETRAMVEFEDVDIFVGHVEYHEATPSLHDYVEGFREGISKAGPLTLVDDREIIISGVPGRELALTFKNDFNNGKTIMRFVIAANRLLQFNVSRNQPDDLKVEDNPIASRFLRSINLLPPLAR
jgi:hypothetical protein